MADRRKKQLFAVGRRWKILKQARREAQRRKMREMVWFEIAYGRNSIYVTNKRLTMSTLTLKANYTDRTPPDAPVFCCSSHER
jgi:hypothetical protein